MIAFYYLIWHETLLEGRRSFQNVTGVGFNGPAQQALTATMNRLNVPAGEHGPFAAALHNLVVTWGTAALNTAADPGEDVHGQGTVRYTFQGAQKNYPAHWSAKPQNWVLHTSCHILILNVW